MNKTQIIELIAEKIGVSKSVSAGMVEEFFDAVASSLKRGDPVTFPKFGTFTVKERSAREGRNPSTGEKILIKASKVIGFKAGKGLKDTVKDAEASK